MKEKCYFVSWINTKGLSVGSHTIYSNKNGKELVDEVIRVVTVNGEKSERVVLSICEV